MAVEVGRPPDGLAGVVDDEVQPLARLAEVVAERLDARRVAQVEPEDLEPVAPLVEVGLLRVASRRVAREAGRDNQAGTRTKQLDPRLVADLDPPAGEERDPAGEIGGLGALGEVEVAAGDAKLVVERVERVVGLLADVTAPPAVEAARDGLVVDLVLLEAGRRLDVGGRVDGLLAQDADPGSGADRLVPLVPCGLLALLRRLHPTPPLDDVGIEDAPGRVEQPRALLDGEPFQHAAVAHDRLERLDGGFQALGSAGGVVVAVARHRQRG